MQVYESVSVQLVYLCVGVGVHVYMTWQLGVVSVGTMLTIPETARGI